MWEGQPSISVAPTALHGIRRKLPAGNSLAPPVVARIAARLVHRSVGGLPLASVSKGTLAGMLLPRRRMYCDAFTFSMRKLITLNSLSCGSDSQVRSLNVLMTAAEVFFAASGTADSGSVVPAGRLSQFLGHSPE